MDTESSIQVLLATAALTTALIFAIRTIGLRVARHLPDLPRSNAPIATPSTLDSLRLLAILTAAVVEEMGTEELFLSSVVELPEPGGAKHWPRVGKMHFFQKKQYRH